MKPEKVIILIVICILSTLLVSCKREHFDKSEMNYIEIIDGKLYLKGFHSEFKRPSVNLIISYDEKITYQAKNGEQTSKIYGIYENAFRYNQEIEIVSFNNGSASELTIFMQRAFMFCANLREIVIPDSVQVIEQNAFNTCIALFEVRMMGLVTLGDTVFAGCSNLKEVVIGDKIESIGSYAFLYCHNDLELTILASTPPVIGLEILKGVENYTIKVPNDALEAYKLDSSWSVYAERIIGIDE